METTNSSRGRWVCERWCKCSGTTARCDCRIRRFGRACEGCQVFLKKVDAAAIAAATRPTPEPK
jgi:hypothetical protein